jgi:hypothetical protein
MRRDEEGSSTLSSLQNVASFLLLILVPLPSLPLSRETILSLFAASQTKRHFDGAEGFTKRHPVIPNRWPFRSEIMCGQHGPCSGLSLASPGVDRSAHHEKEDCAANPFFVYLQLPFVELPGGHPRKRVVLESDLQGVALNGVPDRMELSIKGPVAQLDRATAF